MREVLRRQAQRLHGTLAANEATSVPPPPPAEVQAAAQFERLLQSRLSITEHQRHLLVELHRRAAYSEEAIRQVELELDRFEIALDTQLATVQQPADTTAEGAAAETEEDIELLEPDETASRFPGPRGRPSGLQKPT